MFTLTKRQINIIELMIQSDDFLTADCLAKKLNVSSRTIHNDIHTIELFLKNYSIRMEKTPSKGMRLAAERGSIEKIRNDVHGNHNRDLDYKERRILVYLTLLLNEKVSYDMLCGICHSAKQTAVNDVNDVEQTMIADGLTLHRKQGYGLYLSGEEYRFRLAFEKLVYALDSRSPVLSEIRKQIGHVSTEELKAGIQEVTNLEFKYDAVTDLLMAYFVYRNSLTNVLTAGNPFRNYLDTHIESSLSA